MAGNTNGTGSAHQQFSTTRWSLVLAAARETPESREALETLCRLYWPPIHAYIRRKGYPGPDAEDLAQEFFACLLQSGTVGRADPHRGRFRAYLLGALNHFLAGQRARAHAQKRGGGARPLPLDAGPPGGPVVPEAAANGRSPENVFDREWALQVLDMSLADLRSEFVGDGKQNLF